MVLEIIQMCGLKIFLKCGLMMIKTPLRLPALNDDSEVRNVCFLHNSRYRIVTFHRSEDKTFSKVVSTIHKLKAVTIAAS
jgi:hypothetical protein